MRLSVKRNSQPNRLSAFFKGRKSSATGKHPTGDDEQSEAWNVNASKDSEHAKKEEQTNCSESSKSMQAEYLIVLYRILQEQIINTKEVYSIAGHTITVEVLEDTEL